MPAAIAAPPSDMRASRCAPVGNTGHRGEHMHACTHAHALLEMRTVGERLGRPCGGFEAFGQEHIRAAGGGAARTRSLLDGEIIDEIRGAYLMREAIRGHQRSSELDGEIIDEIRGAYRSKEDAHLNHVQRESWRDGDFGSTFGPRTPVRHVARTPVPDPRIRLVDVEELEGDRWRCLAMLRRLAGRCGKNDRGSLGAHQRQSRGVRLRGSPWQSRGNQGTLGSLWHWTTGTHYQGHTTKGTQ